MRSLLLLIFLIPALLQGQPIESYFSYSTFNSPESGPYIETYLTVIGSSIRYEQLGNNQYQGSVNITYIFRKGEEVERFRKYNILSPVVTDTVNGLVNFLDQQRIMLPNGEYELDIVIGDALDEGQGFSTTQLVRMNYPKDEVSISDIELVQKFQKSDETNMLTKSGYSILPYASSFYPENQKDLKFYVELYNLDKLLGDGTKYLLKYYIQRYEDQKPLSRCVGYSKQVAKNVTVMMKEFNIESLPSGNYELAIELRNQKNELIKIKKLFFQRSNPRLKIDVASLDIASYESSFAVDLPEDSIDYYINSLVPIADPMENRFITHDVSDLKDEVIKRKFIYSFWMKRDELDPEQAFDVYQAQLAEADLLYATQIKKGFETDRGRIFLKYGKPNTVAKRGREPNVYPYEIWQYYQLPVRSNARFVFYNPDLVSNDYALLHSNVFGEINDYRWKYKLQKRDNQFHDLDQTEPDAGAGSWSNDLFNTPR